MLYEERHVILRRGQFGAYRRLVLEMLWPALHDAGARPLCLLNGLIGAPLDETYLYTGFADFEAWQHGQALLTGVSPAGGVVDPALRQRAELIAEEQVRLLLPSDVRPRPKETPVEDRRAVYGLRRFWIAPADWPVFVDHSAGGIWPRIEAQGACILGLFHDAATTDPLEATLITGYHDAAHWQATRGDGEHTPGLAEPLQEGSRRARGGRNEMTLRSYVRLMTAHWPD